MAEVVDSIIAELIARDNGYIAKMKEVVAAHKAVYDSGQKLGTMGNLGSGAQSYADRHKKASKEIADGAEQATSRVKRTTKERSAAEIAAANEVKTATKAARDAERAAAKVAADAVKASEREKQAAAKATAKEQADAAKAALARAEAEKVAAAAAVAAAERETAARVRLAAVAERAVSSRAIPQSTSGRIGATVPNEASGQRSIPASVLNGAPAAAAEAEVNHALIDRFDLAAKAKVAEAGIAREMANQVDWLRRVDLYKRAGLTESQAQLRAETEIAAVEKLRAANAQREASSGSSAFARGAGLGRFAGGPGALAGVAATVGVSAVVGLAKEGLDYAKSLQVVSDQLGITTKSLQTYQTMAASAGVTTEQLRTSFGQAASNLGRAQEGAEEQAREFKRLGIDIGNARDGYKTFGEVLPAIIQRLSSIKEPARRAAIETALFGEEGRKLDSVLSGGIDRVNSLSDSLERTGGILSSAEIARSAKVAQDLQRVGDQLERQLAHTVSENAEAIERLATAFLNAASAALKYIDAMGSQGDSDILNNPGMVRAASRVTGADPSQTEREAFARKLRTPEGRAELFERNTRQMGALAGLANGKELIPNQRGELEKLNVQYKGMSAAEVGKRLAAEQAQIATAAQKYASGLAGGDDNRRGQAGRVGNTGLFTPKPSKGRKSKSADQIEAEYEAELERQRAQQLDATASLTETAEDRAKAAIQALDADHAAFEKRLASYKELSSDQRRELVEAEKKKRQAALDKIERDRLNQISDEIFRVADLDLAAKEDALSAQIALAKTVGERRDLEAQLLAVQKTRDVARLGHQIDVGNRQEATEAFVELQQTDAKYEAKGQQSRAQNRGPLGDYLASLPRTAAQVDEALERAAVNGLQRLNDGLADSLSKMLGLHGAAGDFLNDLIKIGLQMLQVAAFGDGSGGGGGLGGIASTVGAFFGGGEPARLLLLRWRRFDDDWR